MQRIEYNVSTGERVVIQQISIRNDAGDSLVIDAGQKIEEGWYQFDPQKNPLPWVEQVPNVITRRQGRLALLHAGELDNAEVAIGEIGDNIERAAAWIEYEAETWERSNPWIDRLGESLGMTPEDINDLFISASKL